MTYPPPHSAYQHELSANRHTSPHGDQLRAEDNTRPLVGELLRPGMIVRTNYGTGPFMIEAVNHYRVYDGFWAWTLVLNYQRDGRWPARPNDHDRGWINEVVVEWEGDKPRFRMLFAINDDEVFIVADAAAREERSGQLSMF
jgi:hypothetical protein